MFSLDIGERSSTKVRNKKHHAGLQIKFEKKKMGIKSLHFLILHFKHNFVLGAQKNRLNEPKQRKTFFTGNT